MRSPSPGRSEMLRARLLRPNAMPLAAVRRMCTAPKLATVERVGDVAVVRLDDGKMNAFSSDMIAQVNGALDEAADAGAVVLTGNAKCFSAGFCIKTMSTYPSDPAADLLGEGGDMLMRLLTLPQPLVMAVTGHAMALGAMVLMTGDLRIGVEAATPKPHKIGLNEVHIGLPLPSFALPIARGCISPRHLSRATTLGMLYSPEQAVEVGYLDEVVPGEALEARAIEAATALAALGKQGPNGPFHKTKVRQAAEHVHVHVFAEARACRCVPLRSHLRSRAIARLSWWQLEQRKVIIDVSSEMLAHDVAMWRT